ncbi:MAG: hypothetical protein Q9208_004793 [Pyrenodesmia sp. 3 TL-2023]
MEEQDVTNFSSSPHRLPTISASQALQDNADAPQKSISTGLPSLDRIISGKALPATASRNSTGGLPCGQVTEVYGPPGAGKTMFSLNVASNVLLAGSAVAWIDAAYVLNGHRLRDCLTRPRQADGQPPDETVPVASLEVCLGNFHHVTTPTLPHLLALLVHSTASFPPRGTSLLVVDSISTPFNHAFAQTNGHDGKISGKKTDVAQWAAGRRWAVMGDLISAIAKLAATRNMAVIITSQTTTKLKLESAAALQPAMVGTAWDNGINCRIVLFRDWQANDDAEPSQPHGEITSDLRVAAVTKVGGGSVEALGQSVPFAVEQFGLRETNIRFPAIITREATAPLQAVAPKRKRDEIADSASESGDAISGDEFGWVED